MNKVEKYLNEVFSKVPMTDELIEQKEEMTLNMCDKYDALINDGFTSDEAYEEIINNFGSVDELRIALGIETTEKSSTLRRWVFVLSAAMLVILLIFMNIYVNRRMNHLSASLTYAAKELNAVDIDAKNADTDRANSFMKSSNALGDFNDLRNDIILDLNYFERNTLKSTENGLFLSPKIQEMYWRLVDRKRLGIYRDLDQTVKDEFEILASELLRQVEDQRDGVEGYNGESGSKLRAMFYRVDVESLAGMTQKLNELACSYLMYDQLPEDVFYKDIDDLKSILEERFDDKNLNIEIKDSSLSFARRYNGICGDIQVMTDYGNFYLSMDIVSGDIRSIDSGFLTVDSGYEDSLDESCVKELLDQYFDPDYSYEIIDKGYDYKKSSDKTSYYSYEFIPHYGSWPVLNEGMQPLIHIDISDKRILDVRGFPKSSNFISNNDYKYDYITALDYANEKQQNILSEIVGNNNSLKFFYIESGISETSLSGKLELMHIYEEKESGRRIKIRAKDGFIDNLH